MASIVPPFVVSVAETLTRRLVEKMDKPRVRLEPDLVARLELMAFAEHRDDFFAAELGDDLQLRPCRLDHLDLGVGAVVGKHKMLRPHAAQRRAAVAS